MPKRIETDEDKVKLTVLIPKSVAVAIKEEAKVADESQSLFIVTLWELYLAVGSATEPIATDVVPVVQSAPAPIPAAPPVPKMSAMARMDESIDDRFGGKSTGQKMLDIRLGRERGGRIEQIRRQSQAATESEE